jgi:cobalamin biosynthesis Mg chelatase CobN
MVAGLFPLSTGATLRAVMGSRSYYRVLALIAALILCGTAAACGSTGSQTLSRAADTFATPTTPGTTRTTVTERTTTTSPAQSTTVTTTKTAAAPPAATVTNRTINNNAAAVKVTSATTTAKSDDGPPAWAWVLIALGVVAIATLIFFAGRGQRNRGARAAPVAEGPPEQGPPGPSAQ